MVVVLFALERGFSDFMSASYADMAAVVSDDAILRGWIPEFLPGDAHDIYERHNIDTNEGWGTFSFGQWDEAERTAHWRTVSSAPRPRSPNRFVGCYYVSWWPGDLDAGYVYFQGIQEQRFWLAVDFERQVGYFWQDG
jgi:hypothetical protein